MISFLGVRTDRHDFGILIWKHVGTQKKINSKLKLRFIAINPYMHPRMTGMHNNTYTIHGDVFEKI